MRLMFTSAPEKDAQIFPPALENLVSEDHLHQSREPLGYEIMFSMRKFLAL